MQRKSFLKGLGLAGLGSLIPINKSNAAIKPDKTFYKKLGVDCVLIPHETAGPYPLDLSDEESYFRTDITEEKPGMQLDLTITIVSIQDDCKPIANARVDLWQTDKDGVYSGFVQPGANTVGETFCRGIQITDVNGQVKFKTIYPGWYPGRTTHNHFQVFLSNVLSATSQMAFPDAINTLVYDSPLYITKGQNTTIETTADDSVFADGYEDQLLTLTPNLGTGGYDGTITVGIDEPATGLIDLAPETGGQFTLSANYPNPFHSETTIPFTLLFPAEVKIDLYNLMGVKVAELMHEKLGSGNHNCIVNRNKYDSLPAGNYAYQLTTLNAAGKFMQVKMLTIN